MEVMAMYGGNCWCGDADVALKMGRIMLKYRPIAPKPTTAAALTAAPLDAKSKSSRRGKKKNPTGARRGRKPTKKFVTSWAFSEEDKSSGSSSSSSSSSSSVVTLPLMPVTPERKEEEPPVVSDGHVSVSTSSSALKQKVGTTNNYNGSGTGEVAVVVTVECLIDTCRSAVPIPTGLLNDTCPVFLSDAYDRVTWANEAYRRMVVGSTSTEVALVTRGLVPARDEGVTCFVCRVRVRYTCWRRGKVSMAAPCDVWRLVDGRLVWRLDVDEALSLSLGS